MAYQATVMPIMLASPGDVPEERHHVREAIHDWNYIHSIATNTVLMPVGWETHSAPDLGGRPQELINQRVLADCDLLVGIFWTRLGTPTGKAESGSVEEIHEHLDAGKPAMIYFSSKPIAPAQFDADQFNQVKNFREWCQSRGLYQTFDSSEDFRLKFARDLQINILKNPYLQAILARASTILPIHPSASAPAAETKAEPGAGLTDEAKALLLEMSNDRQGIVMKIFVMGGRFFQVNGNKLGLSEEPREFERWNYGLEQLIGAEYVRQSDSKGEVFRITEPGYRLVDAMKPASAKST